jgi:hypothetical protein
LRFKLCSLAQGETHRRYIPLAWLTTSFCTVLYLWLWWPDLDYILFMKQNIFCSWCSPAFFYTFVLLELGTV